MTYVGIVSYSKRGYTAVNYQYCAQDAQFSFTSNDKVFLFI